MSPRQEAAHDHHWDRPTQELPHRRRPTALRRDCRHDPARGQQRDRGPTAGLGHPLDPTPVGGRGAAGLGRGVAQGLAGAGESVLDVPAQLAARARLLNTGHARKSDPIDATSVAAVAQHHRRLHPVQAEDHSVVLRLLSERRDDLSEERTRTVNRLHALLRDLVPGGAKRNLTAAGAAALLRAVRPLTVADEQRKAVARDLLADLRRVDSALERNAADTAAAVAANGTTLTELRGIGPVPAARIVGHTSTVARSPSGHHSPSYCGPAPIEASSGDQRGHRLSRAGNRQLNRALHLV